MKATTAKQATGTATAAKSFSGFPAFAPNIMNIKTKAATFTATNVIGIGSKGTGMALAIAEGTPMGEPVTFPWASFKTAGVKAVDLCARHAQGKPFGGGMACYDAQCHLSEKGQPIVLLPLKQALAKGLVKPLKVSIHRDGQSRIVTAYVRGDWKAAEKLPWYLATLDTAGGRIERAKIHETGGKPSRNVALAYRVTLPGAQDETKASAKGQKPPAAPSAKSGKGRTAPAPSKPATKAPSAKAKASK